MMTQKRFLREYTRPHELKAGQVGSARMLKKEEGRPCPFFDLSLPGCLIHPVKPQVCRAAFYLSKMNLILCQEQKKIGTIPGCPADALLQKGLDEFRFRLDQIPGGNEDLAALFFRHNPEADLFLLLLRLKGMEIYFGGDKAERLARRVGLQKLPEGEELKEAAWLYVACRVALPEGTKAP